MKIRDIISAFCLLFTLSIPPVVKPQSQENPSYKIDQLTEKVFVLSMDVGGYADKAIASVGSDGLLLVESGDKENGSALKEALMTFRKGLPKIIINTHSHIEHVGGNIAVGDSAMIIGHEKMRDRYINGGYIFNDIPEKYLPQITFKDSMSVYFNGEEIKLLAFPGAHDNSDIIVWFTNSKVVCTAALCSNKHFPSIDGEYGDIMEYIPTVEKVISRLPDDIKVVPGHSDNCTMKEFKEFRDMLVTTSNIVNTEIEKGSDLSAMIEKDILADWTSYESYATKDYWIQLWYNGFKNPRPIQSDKPKPYRIILDKINSEGAVAAINLYRKLKSENNPAYFYDDRILMYIGTQLWAKQKNEDAVLFLRACINEIPESDAAYKSYGRLGAIYRGMKKPELAKECYNKYLERFPFDKRVAKIVSEL